MVFKTEIEEINGSWEGVVNLCRSTVSKPPLGKEPSQQFKKEILISEHTPIRDFIIKWKWKGIKSWVAVHWVRHKWECYVSTQRTDRTGIDRDKMPQDALVDFIGVADAQHLIDTWRKRLCKMSAKETREFAEDFKIVLHNELPELANVLVPNCVYRCGCPEMHIGTNKCNFWNNFSKNNFVKDSIQQRYDCYNEWFYRSH